MLTTTIVLLVLCLLLYGLPCEQVDVPQGIKGFINIAFAPRSVCIVLGVACDSHISFILFSWTFDDRR